MKLQVFSTILSKKGEILTRALSTTTSCKCPVHMTGDALKFFQRVFFSATVNVLMSWISSLWASISMATVVTFGSTSWPMNAVWAQILVSLCHVGFQACPIDSEGRSAWQDSAFDKGGSGAFDQLVQKRKCHWRNPQDERSSKHRWWSMWWDS